MKLGADPSSCIPGVILPQSPLATLSDSNSRCAYTHRQIFSYLTNRLLSLIILSVFAYQHSAPAHILRLYDFQGGWIGKKLSRWRCPSQSDRNTLASLSSRSLTAVASWLIKYFSWQVPVCPRRVCPAYIPYSLTCTCLLSLSFSGCLCIYLISMCITCSFCCLLLLFSLCGN